MGNLIELLHSIVLLHFRNHPQGSFIELHPLCGPAAILLLSEVVLVTEATALPDF